MVSLPVRVVIVLNPETEFHENRHSSLGPQCLPSTVPSELPTTQEIFEEMTICISEWKKLSPLNVKISIFSFSDSTFIP